MSNSPEMVRVADLTFLQHTVELGGQAAVSKTGPNKESI